jgi:hypothetical protein
LLAGAAGWPFRPIGARTETQLKTECPRSQKTPQEKISLKRNTMNDSEIFSIEVFEYLDDLRESGEVNMFGAGPYLQERFGLTRAIAREYLFDWMESFKK